LDFTSLTTSSSLSMERLQFSCWLFLQQSW